MKDPIKWLKKREKHNALKWFSLCYINKLHYALVAGYLGTLSQEMKLFVQCKIALDFSHHKLILWKDLRCHSEEDAALWAFNILATKHYAVELNDAQDVDI